MSSESTHHVFKVSIDLFNASFFGTPRNRTLTPPDPFYGIPRDRITTTAFHDSDENEGVSKCLPYTREDILDEITKWDQYTSPESICRVCRLLSIAKNLVLTISYRHAVLFPSVGQQLQANLSHNPLILSQCRSDPLILSQCYPGQVDELILQPLHPRSPATEHVACPDRCSEEECRNLVRVVSSSVLDHVYPKPVRSLLFGRREPAIYEELQSLFYTLAFADFPYMPILKSVSNIGLFPEQPLEQHPLLEAPAEKQRTPYPILSYPLNPANVERFDDISRTFVNVNGGYTAQDNRRINRNIEYVETYYEYRIDNNGQLKAACVGGALTSGGFYLGFHLGHTTAQVEGCKYHRDQSQLALPENKNNALKNYYPAVSVGQLPSLVLTFVILSKVVTEIFCFIRQMAFK